MSAIFEDWACPACKEADNVEVQLEHAEDGMVCPRCAKVDPHATSIAHHVDVSNFTGQILEPVETLQNLESSRQQDTDSRERSFLVSRLHSLSSRCQRSKTLSRVSALILPSQKHVDGLIRANLQKIFGVCNYNLENGSRLWFERVRKLDQEHRGLARPMVLVDTRRLPYFVLLAVRLAVQESNLITIYNRLPGAKLKSPRAVQYYCKGDDLAFSVNALELFVSPSSACFPPISALAVQC